MRDQLRKHFRSMRTQLTPEQRRDAEQLITQHLKQLLKTAAAPTVGAYNAIGGEVSLSQTFAELPRVRFALPRVSGSHIQFHVRDPAQLSPNRWGILEPAASAPQVLLSEMDLLLIPLVAYDEFGTRLGMGGGYYDRYLAQDLPRPRRIGVAFAGQQHAQLPCEAWDIPLHAVVTEDGVLDFSAQQ
ncbi:MAG: 5-formyltetrahydrofolate cyclo-ligase [Pseudomonadota bacterium]